MSQPKLRIPRPQPAPGTSVGSQPDSPAPRGRGDGTQVWLVRHAVVHEDWHQRAYGGLDVPLSTYGEQQTQAMGEAFGAAFGASGLSAVTSSNLARAAAMGRSIAKATGAPLAVDPRLREIDRGAWQGDPSQAFRQRWEADPAFFEDPWNWKGHDGESDADLYARVGPAFDDVARAAAQALSQV